MNEFDMVMQNWMHAGEILIVMIVQVWVLIGIIMGLNALRGKKHNKPTAQKPKASRPAPKVTPSGPKVSRPGAATPEEFPMCPFDHIRNRKNEKQVVFRSTTYPGYFRCIRGHYFTGKEA